jgi:hypothetical protein
MAAGEVALALGGAWCGVFNGGLLTDASEDLDGDNTRSMGGAKRARLLSVNSRAFNFRGFEATRAYGCSVAPKRR